MMLMRKEELSGGGNHGGSTWARACDTCGSSPCRVYCRADRAYLCSGCDAGVHSPSSRHERVSVCEACERSPAAFLCKADAASLCAACDADVHAANPLAHRHHRVPILPLYGPSAAAPGALRSSKRATALQMAEDEFNEEDEDEAASWLLLNSSTHTERGSKNNDNTTNGYFLGADVDEYLDLVEYTSGAGDDLQLNTVDREPQFDSVVPNRMSNLGLDFDVKSGFAYNTSSNMTHSETFSSLDVGIVPDSTMSEISTTNPQTPKGTIDLFSCHPLQQMPTQLSPMDREAKVMRYREKKKTRKFEKTIRYASRKAYAETRPRIKGRFAKRTNADQVQIMADGGYGIVPSF